MMTHHQHNFEKVWGDAHERLSLAEQIIIERRHAVVVRHTRKKVHENHLRITLATIPWFLLASLGRRAAFDYNDRRSPMTGHARCVNMGINKRPARLPNYPNQTHCNVQHTPWPCCAPSGHGRSRHSSWLEARRISDPPRAS